MFAKANINIYIKEKIIQSNQNIGQKRKRPASEHLINENIPHPKLFVLGPEGEQIGVMTRAEALEKAAEMKMDLVLISINPKPIAKILDYGKFKYLRSKKKKEEKAKQSRTENRQIRLTPFIGDNDIKTKAKKAREFLLDGDFVKVSLKFKGREIQRPEFGHETLMKFYKEVEDISSIAKEPVLNGKFLDMFLQQDKKKIIQYNKLNKNKVVIKDEVKEDNNHEENEEE